MKTRIIILLFCLTLLVPSVIASEFWASKKSNKYHYPDCRWAQKINPANLIKFKSPEEAQNAGYIPCKVCRPPVASRAESEEQRIVLSSVLVNDNDQKRGCCSWHGGVCGCDYATGRAICCDGTLSPTCTCQ